MPEVEETQFWRRHTSKSNYRISVIIGYLTSQFQKPAHLIATIKPYPSVGMDLQIKLSQNYLLLTIKCNCVVLG